MKNENPTILSTTDYDSMIFYDFNRKIDSVHLRRLIQSITRKNLLYLSPVLLSDKMEVIDGQHRIEAAKALKVPIYYIVANDFDHEDIIALNNAKKTWTTEDFFNFFYIKGERAFQITKDLMDKHNISLYTSLIVLSGNGKMNLKELRGGVIDVSQSSAADVIVSCIKDYKPYFRDNVEMENREFVRCIRKLYLNEYNDSFIKKDSADITYDHNSIIKILKENPILKIGLEYVNKKGNISISGEFAFLYQIMDIQKMG